MTAEVPKRPLDALLLATLAGSPRHGYAIKEALRAGSGGRFDLPTGTIYPALHRLERAGLICGSAPAVSGRRRRSYQLTAAGRPAQRPALLLTGALCRGHHPARGGTMAGAGMSDPQPDPLGDDAVEDYLATITAQLTGPAAARAAIADELRDGLLETRQAHLSHGRSAWETTAAAIAEFGDLHAVAAGFGPELAAAQAHRAAFSLLVTGLLVGLSWIAAAAVNALPPWRHQLSGPWLALPPVGLALAVAGPALGVAIATTGRLSSRLRSPADQQATLPLTPVVIAALAAATADLTLLAIIAGHALTTPGALRWAPVVVAVVASITRGTLPAQAARRCLGTRAALT